MKPIRLDEISRSSSEMFRSGLKGLNPFAVIGGLFVGSLVFGLAIYMMKDQSSETRASASEDPNISQPEKNEAEPTPVETIVPTPTPTPAPTRALLLREISAPWNIGRGKKDHLRSFTDVALNHDGSRILTASESQVIYWDAATGQQRHVFERGEARQGSLFIAPDARAVVALSYRTRAVTVHDPDTGKALGVYAVKGELNDYSLGCQPTFAVGGTEFVVVERILNAKNERHYQLHVISTRTGQGKVLAKPFRIQTENQTHDLRALYAVPGQPLIVALVKHKPQSFFTIHTETGEVKQLPWPTNEAIQVRHPGYGLTFTPNGSRLLYKPEKSSLVLGNWSEGAGRLMPPVGLQRLAHDWRITPDGERAVRINVWNTPDFNTGHEVQEGYQIDYLELVDLARSKVLGRIDHTAFQTHHKDNVLQGATLSGDGRTLALIGAGRISLVDFQQAFKTDPLPPVAVAQGYLR